MSRLLVTNKSFELLEPYEGKLSRTVLRGESSRKGADLLDRYNIEISLSSNISPEKRLSLVVCHEPLEDLMEVMSSLMSIRYRIDGNRVLITQR